MKRYQQIVCTLITICALVIVYFGIKNLIPVPYNIPALIFTLLITGAAAYAAASVFIFND